MFGVMDQPVYCMITAITFPLLDGLGFVGA